MASPAAWHASGCLRPHTILPGIWHWLFTLITPAPHCAGSPFPLPSIRTPKSMYLVISLHLTPVNLIILWSLGLRAAGSFPPPPSVGWSPRASSGLLQRWQPVLLRSPCRDAAPGCSTERGGGLTQRRSNLHVPGFGHLLLIHTKGLCGFAAACLACAGGHRAALPTETQA